jgi:chitin disaccharide deacetylase
MKKALIINADDLGADEGRNKGIREGVHAGIIKSVSLLANGWAIEDVFRDVEEGKFKGISIGIHLNLSEGRPTSNDLRMLVGSDGAFRGKAAAQQLCLQEGNSDLEEEISWEVESQIVSLRRAGIPISHMDGHQHIHVFPAVLGVALHAAKKFGIPWIRIPYEPCPPPDGENIQEALRSEAGLFSGLGGKALSMVAGSGIRTTDHFCGLYLRVCFSTARLEGCLHNLSEGVTELMVHPGRVPAGGVAGPFSNFSTLDRKKELDALLSPTFGETLRRTRARLISFLEAHS